MERCQRGSCGGREGVVKGREKELLLGVFFCVMSSDHGCGEGLRRDTRTSLSEWW